MASLNFKHLRYFWMVAKAGSIAKAATQLHLTPHSISAQLGTLEDALGVTLFHRTGRRMTLTEHGERILEHADEIFSLGDRIIDLVQEDAEQSPLPFRIGVADSVPKMMVYRLIEPALQLERPPRLVCRENTLAELLGGLALHRIDMVIADRPMPSGLGIRGYSHLLGESVMAVFAAPSLVERLGSDFPACLDRMPFLMPGEDVAYRPQLMQWFAATGVRPRIVAEFDDSALIKAFGQAGAGAFVAPAVISSHICEHYRVHEIGRIDNLREQFHAITSERKLTHPVMRAISEQARAAFA